MHLQFTIIIHIWHSGWHIIFGPTLYLCHDKSIKSSANALFKIFSLSGYNPTRPLNWTFVDNFARPPRHKLRFIEAFQVSFNFLAACVLYHGPGPGHSAPLSTRVKCEGVRKLS